MGHAMARLTPLVRQELAELVVEEGWTHAAVADRYAVSRATVHKWVSRYRQEGPAGMADRSSRPHRCPNQVPQEVEVEILRLRVADQLGPHLLAAETGVPRSTVYRVLRRYGMNRLRDLSRPRRRVVRYERDRPGELVHIDVKKLARIPNGGGHRVWGRKARPSQDRRTGHDYVHVAVDDRTRMAFVEVYPDQKGSSCVHFLHHMVTFFAAYGVAIESVMTDNARNYVDDRGFQTALTQLGIKHLRTRPYRPQTNGKAERFIQTLKRRWAYNPTYTTNQQRLASLDAWVDLYNHRRPHTAHKGNPPSSAL